MERIASGVSCEFLQKIKNANFTGFSGEEIGAKNSSNRPTDTNEEWTLSGQIPPAPGSVNLKVRQRGLRDREALLS